MVSLHPYAALLEQIVGDEADVVQLLPSGASPHTFDPTPSQAASIAKADLIVMNGNVDGWLDRLVQASAPDVPRFVVLDALSFEPIGGDDHEADEHAHAVGAAQAGGNAVGVAQPNGNVKADGNEAAGGDDQTGGGVKADGNANAGVNPHVWLDPVLMARLMPSLADALAEVDPTNAETFRANAEAVAQRLQQLDARLRTMLEPIRGAAFVPFHDAWPYFARRYGLDLVVTIEPFPGREPSARFVAEAVAAIRAAGAKAVFSERQLNPRPAQVVAEAAGVALAVLDPIGRDDQSYDALLLENATTLLSTLAPEAP